MSFVVILDGPHASQFASHKKYVEKCMETLDSVLIFRKMRSLIKRTEMMIIAKDISYEKLFYLYSLQPEEINKELLEEIEWGLIYLLFTIDNKTSTPSQLPLLIANRWVCIFSLVYCRYVLENPNHRVLKKIRSILPHKILK